jgi:hypothetical protein
MHRNERSNTRTSTKLTKGPAAELRRVAKRMKYFSIIALTIPLLVEMKSQLEHAGQRSAHGRRNPAVVYLDDPRRRKSNRFAKKGPLHLFSEPISMTLLPSKMGISSRRRF